MSGVGCNDNIVAGRGVGIAILGIDITTLRVGIAILGVDIAILDVDTAILGVDMTILREGLAV